MCVNQPFDFWTRFSCQLLCLMLDGFFYPLCVWIQNLQLRHALREASALPTTRMAIADRDPEQNQLASGFGQTTAVPSSLPVTIKPVFVTAMSLMAPR